MGQAPRVVLVGAPLAAVPGVPVKHDYRPREWRVETYVRRATIELELEGARISLVIEAGDGLLEMLREQIDIHAFGDVVPVRSYEGEPRLNLEIEGRMGTCVFTYDGSDGRPTTVAPERSQ